MKPFNKFALLSAFSLLSLASVGAQQLRYTNLVARPGEAISIFDSIGNQQVRAAINPTFFDGGWISISYDSFGAFRKIRFYFEAFLNNKFVSSFTLHELFADSEGFTIVLSKQGSNEGFNGIFMMKVSRTLGNVLWSRTYKLADNDSLDLIAAVQRGSSYYLLTRSSSHKAVLVRVLAGGAVDWSYDYDIGTDTNALDIAGNGKGVAVACANEDFNTLNLAPVLFNVAYNASASVRTVLPSLFVFPQKNLVIRSTPTGSGVHLMTKDENLDAVFMRLSSGLAPIGTAMKVDDTSNFDLEDFEMGSTARVVAALSDGFGGSHALRFYGLFPTTIVQPILVNYSGLPSYSSVIANRVQLSANGQPLIAGTAQINGGSVRLFEVETAALSANFPSCMADDNLPILKAIKIAPKGLPIPQKTFVNVQAIVASPLFHSTFTEQLTKSCQ